MKPTAMFAACVFFAGFIFALCVSATLTGTFDGEITGVESGAGAPATDPRDYFAASADVNPYRPLENYKRQNDREPTAAELAAFIAELRYAEADAMLAKRGTTPAATNK